MGEIWRPVKASRLLSYPGGVFEGSSLGRVRVLGEVRDGSPDKDGYLRSKYLGRWYYHHIIMALAWHGAPEVRHLGDGVTDNRPDKVCWGSRKDNEWDKREKRRKENIGHRPVPPRTS